MTIGAGGGSFAWIDQAGSLRNGPQSAGAHPGPACYGRGNDKPTNTDANLVLGRLGAELIGGAMTLDRPAAERAIQDHVATPLGLGLVEAADAVIKVANANMADAVRLISIRRGYDPREFCLVAFGGAGPRGGARRGAVDSDGARTAEPRHHVCARLPARRRTARPFCDVPRPSRLRRPAEAGGGIRPARARRTRAPRGRGRPGGADVDPAARRHALPRSVAVADGARLVAGRSRGRGRAFPCGARTRLQLPPRRIAGRDLPVERARS